MRLVVTDVYSVYEYMTKRMRRDNSSDKPGHIISYQLSGRYDHTVNGERIEVSADTLFFINRKDSYSVECIEQGSSLCVCFAADTDIPTLAVDVSNDPRARTLFNKIMKNRDICVDGDKYKAVSAIYELFSIISDRQTARMSAERDDVESLRDFIARNYQRTDFDLEEAMPKGGGRKYFNNLFRGSYGLTPTQYVISLRMNTAASLLKNEMLTVSEIALLVGYDDLFYFSRLFKKHFGISPTKYRAL